MLDICLFWNSPRSSSLRYRFFFFFFFIIIYIFIYLTVKNGVAGLHGIWQACWTFMQGSHPEGWVETAQHLGRNLPCRKWKCRWSCHLKRATRLQFSCSNFFLFFSFFFFGRWWMTKPYLSSQPNPDSLCFTLSKRKISLKKRTPGFRQTKFQVKLSFQTKLPSPFFCVAQGGNWLQFHWESLRNLCRLAWGQNHMMRSLVVL